MNRDDLALYVSGNYDGDVAALEREIAADPALQQMLAEEARLEMLLRDAGAAATFCPACSAVADERCNACGVALRPGGYVVERVLVANAHGRMYVARDADGRRVALKELAFVSAPSAAAVAAFEREAKLLRALEHPAIPRFVASFEEGQGVHARYYLAQELVEGAALDARLADHWFREDEIRELARGVLEVLVYLQSLSPMVIHRDVKPANLIRRGDGSIALVDFGAAHVTGATAGSTTIGTFGYMPVEQLAGIVDGTSDVYALGASLVHLLTRQEPWKILQDPGLAMNVSAPLRAWLAKATAADPKARFASAKDALVALDARAPVAKRPPKALVAGAIAVAVAAVGGGGFAALHAFIGRTPQRSTFPASPQLATLKLELGAGGSVDVLIDRREVAHGAKSGATIPFVAGMHHIDLKGAQGQICTEVIQLEPGKTTTVECYMAAAPAPAPEAHLPRGKIIDAAFDHAKLHDVLRWFGERCEWNIVVPDSIQADVTLHLVKVPCDQALEVVLEAHGLWYVYDSGTNLVRIAPRKELDRDREDARARANWRDELGPEATLPVGSKIDLDFKDAPLVGVLRMFATAEHVNVVVPDDIGAASVTVKVKGVPWTAVFENVLAAHGLWYRYRDNGKLLRIAPRKELDREDEDELARRKR